MLYLTHVELMTTPFRASATVMYLLFEPS